MLDRFWPALGGRAATNPFDFRRCWKRPHLVSALEGGRGGEGPALSHALHAVQDAVHCL